MALWRVRAGKAGEFEQLHLQLGVVSIGWNCTSDLRGVTRDEVAARIRLHFPDATEAWHRNATGQVWALVGRMKGGELVVMPLKQSAALAIGEVIGPYAFRADLPEGARHTRPVRWLRDDLPRTAVSQDLLHSVGAIQTVCRISRNDAELRFRALAAGCPDPMPAAGADPTEDTGGDEGERDLAQDARDAIQAHIIAKLKGHGLARLVEGILRAQGYQTHLSSPGPDGGVDILAGQGPMGFDAPMLAVQVKSSDTPIEVGVLRELQGVMRSFGAQQGLLVSWGGFRSSVPAEARKLFFEIRLWDAGQLVDALCACYPDLSDDLQAEVPLKRIWTLVTDV